ncbi:hypothetical protein K239x_10940 [Planctomycetes bacterium K23_9]|uniref:Uncharacterized protein n=1 Tax=Stieleria marina TaxID=1930275 RepID=A0A517NPW3_9BACT|nr:hypothetical protein K239x_10940 [Planctomycetes bacterium K23_9]
MSKHARDSVFASTESENGPQGIQELIDRPETGQGLSAGITGISCRCPSAPIQPSWELNCCRYFLSRSFFRALSLVM